MRGAALRIVETVENRFEIVVERGMRIAFGQQPHQGREMRHPEERMRQRKISAKRELVAFDRVVAEMLVEPRAPCRAHSVAGLQHRLEPRAEAAAHQPEMAAVLAREQFGDGAGLAVAADAEHDAFVSPLHRIDLAKIACGREDYSFGNSRPISR